MGKTGPSSTPGCQVWRLALSLVHVHRSSPCQASEGQAPVAAEPPGTALASAAGFGGGTRVPSPSLLSTFNDLPPGLLRPNGHPSHVWEAESERCALPLIAQLLFLLLTGLLTYCEYQERGTYRVVRCWKRCLTVYPYPLRLGGEPPQNGSCDGTMGRHPDLSPWAVWGQV